MLLNSKNKDTSVDKDTSVNTNTNAGETIDKDTSVDKDTNAGVDKDTSLDKDTSVNTNTNAGVDKDTSVNTNKNKDAGETNTNDKDKDTSVNTISNAVIPKRKPNISPNTKEKIPNTIIFYIKTRIPNFYNIIFTPQMLVPKVRSDTVFINPLVKYSKRAIMDLPNSAPKETVLTQFFLANEFDTMIGRNLNSFFNMQSEQSYSDAKMNGTIDNNIDLTVKILFKKNNVVYINGKPYTIVDYNHHKGDWELDKKPVEKLVGLSGNNKNVDKDADDELSNIDDVLRYGTASARGISKLQTQPQIQKPALTRKEGELNKQFVKESEKLQKLPRFLDYLLGGDLVKNDPINYEPIFSKMIPSEPITFLLVIGLDDIQFTDFVGNTEKNGDNGINLYNSFIDSKGKLSKKAQDFFTIIVQEYAPIIREYKNVKQNINDDIQGKVNSTDIKPNILKLIEQKKKYMETIRKLSQTLTELFGLQKPYFDSVVSLLKYIKENYVKMIGYKQGKIATLANKCFDYDLSVFTTLSGQNISPELSVYQTEYIGNIETYIRKDKQWFRDFEAEFLSNYNTANELNKYKNNYRIMYMEMKQYDIYMLIIMFHCFINQSDIWKIYFQMLPRFITDFANEAKSKIDVFQTELTNYNKFVAELEKKGKSEPEEQMLSEFNRRMKESNGTDLKLYSLSDKDSCARPKKKSEKISPSLEIFTTCQHRLSLGLNC